MNERVYYFVKSYDENLTKTTRRKFWSNFKRNLLASLRLERKNHS